MRAARSMRCPCGTGDTYAACCEPFHLGVSYPATALLLMRSRYSAFAVGDPIYLRDTWDPRTRPSDISLDPATEWTWLEILNISQGGPFDTEGIVEFRAHHRSPKGRATRHERSRFAKKASRWLYVDGDTLAD